MNKSPHMVRQIRMQMKSGFLKSEPEAYKFLKRYPPLSRDTAPAMEKVSKKQAPYLDLYEKEVNRNPLYGDEAVYPAYWQQEPQALVLAKKQYEHMQAGLSEAAAHDKAIDFIQELESRSYEELKGLKKLVKDKDAALPFAADMTVSKQIADWQAVVLKTPYEDLTLEQKGDIDYLIQTKLLKWREVERERRMKDPVFVKQFELLRNSLFPVSVQVTEKRSNAEREEFRQNFFELYNVDPKGLATKNPFYYEDYAEYFAKIQRQPLLAEWSPEERFELSNWIIQTVSLNEILDKGDIQNVQKYVNMLRSQFFPMVRSPALAYTLKFPSKEEFKAILYENDVGYKRENSKLYVRRYYRIPMLLFPKETVAAGSILMPPGTVAPISEEAGEEAMQNEVDSFKSSSSDRLDAAFARLEDEEYEDSDDEEYDEEDEDSVTQHFERQYDKEVEKAKIQRESHPPGVWDALVLKYAKRPTTLLEREREKLLNAADNMPFDLCSTELDLHTYQNTRFEQQVMLRARLAHAYEEKEAARRVAEWEARGVKDIPYAPLGLEE